MTDPADDPIFDAWPADSDGSSAAAEGETGAGERPPSLTAPDGRNRHRGGPSGSPLEDLEDALGHTFTDQGLLRRALVHASAAPLRHLSNERLEFLGDAVFGAAVCADLYERLPSSDEGELTRIKSVVVSRKTCATITRGIGLDRFVVLGRGVATKGGRVPGSILAGVYEAVVAAIFLDAGPEAADAFVRRTTAPHVEASLAAPVSDNFKSALQQSVQQAGGEAPVYRVVGERGPDHSKAFRVEAVVEGTAYEPAWGPNKKVAEQRAAGNAIAQTSGRQPPYAGEGH